MQRVERGLPPATGPPSKEKTVTTPRRESRRTEIFLSGLEVLAALYPASSYSSDGCGDRHREAKSTSCDGGRPFSWSRPFHKRGRGSPKRAEAGPLRAHHHKCRCAPRQKQ
jgi:hypothetical protein